MTDHATGRRRAGPGARARAGLRVGPWAVVAVMALASVLLALVGPTGPAAAISSSPGPLQVQLTGLDPAAPAPGGTVSIVGSVVNTTDRPAREVSVVLRVSPTPLVSRAEVAAVLAQTTTRRGQAVPSTRAALAAELAPGAAAPFRITVPTQELPWQGNGVYALFVQAAADVGSAAAAVPVPWLPAPQDVVPSGVAVVNPLLAPVDLTASGALLTDTLPRSMAPGGRLAALADAGAAAAAAGVPISWLVDPAVMAAAQGMADGTATFADGGGAGLLQQVRQWLATVEAARAAPGASNATTGYGQVDATAVLRADEAELLDDSLALASSAGSGAAEPDASTAVDLITPLPPGTADPSAIDGLASRGAGTVVLSQDVAPPVQPQPFTPSGIGRWELAAGSLAAVIPDPVLQQALEAASGSDSERFAARQSVLADLAMITLELPTSPRIVVLMPPPGAAPPADWYSALLQDLGRVPFIRPVGLPALLDPAAPAPQRTLVPTPDAAALPVDYLAPVPALQQRLAAFADVVVGPLAFADDYRTALARSASIQWRPAQPLGSRLLAAIGDDLSGQEAKVTTISSGNVTLTGSSGILPLTLSNNLEQDVEVGVLLEGDPAIRLNFIPPALTVVGAGRRDVVEIPVEVFGTGPLPVSVTLIDRNGRPFITTGDLELRATAANRIAAGFAAVGGAMLLGMVVWRFRKRGSGAAQPDGADDAG